VEAAAAGEGVGRAEDLAAGGADLGLHRFQVVGVEDDQGRARLVASVGVETAVETFVEGGVRRAVVDEGPAEGLLVEALGADQVAAGSST
jgi:hypothetical protein